MCIWGLLRALSHNICNISDPANLLLLLTSFPIYLKEKLIVDSRGKCWPWVQQGRKKYKQINNIHLTSVFKNRVKHQFWLTTFLLFLKRFQTLCQIPDGLRHSCCWDAWSSPAPTRLQAAALFWATVPTPQQVLSFPATHWLVCILQSCCFCFLALILWSNPSLGLDVVGSGGAILIKGLKFPSLALCLVLKSQYSQHTFFTRVFILPATFSQQETL